MLREHYWSALGVTAPSGRASAAGPVPLGVHEVTLGAAKTLCIPWAVLEAEPEARAVCRWFPWETIPGDRAQEPGKDQQRR